MSRYGTARRFARSFLTIALLLLIPTRSALAQSPSQVFPQVEAQDNLPQAEALFPATLQGMERESARKWSNDRLVVEAEASYFDASTDTRAALDLVVVDVSFVSLYPPEIHGSHGILLRQIPNRDDLEEITVGDQTAYVMPEDDEGALVAFVPLAEYAFLRVTQCCGRGERDLRALITGLDMQQLRSAADAHAEAEENAELRSLLMAVPPSIAEYPLRTHEIHGESGSYLVELSYPTTDTARNKIKVTIFASASAMPSGEILTAIGPPDKLEQGIAEGWITQTKLAGHDAYLTDTEDDAGVFVTDGAHALLAVGGPSSIISLETLLEDLTEARIEAFFAGVASIVAESDSVSSDGGAPMCPDEACFKDAFAVCQPARFQAEQMGVVAVYEIIEPVGESCRLSLIYERNPNPAWVGQPLYFTTSPSPDASFMEAVQQALNACVQGEASNCDGPLYDLMQE